MTLDELKKKLLIGVDMGDIYERIEQEAKDGESVMRTHADLSDLQVARLRQDGYKVYYDRNCSWWEISGWSE